MTRLKHPQHEQVAQAVRGWFRQPFEGMGFRSEVGTYGTYWSTGMVYPSRAAAADPAGFLADLRSYYGRAIVVINLDDNSLEEQLAPALAAAGWRKDSNDVFLAHVGPVPEANPGPAIELEPAAEANLREFAWTGLIAFDDVEAEPDGETLAAEMARRREELTGSGRGLLARFEGAPAGIMRWFEEPHDIWIRGLAVRPVYRGLGIGNALLRRRLAEDYAAGRRSVLINVDRGNSDARRLYDRLGFTDEVYWRIQLILPQFG